MKIREIMTTRPLTVDPEERPEELLRLMEAARIHHLPLVHEGRLVGLWLATEKGPMVMVAPERVREMSPDEDAVDAVAALVGGSEAVVVWSEAERPVGILTRTDVLRMLSAAMNHGLGRRYRHPVVLRLVGPAGAGKSTLIRQTVERMRRCEVVVLQANAATSDTRPNAEIGGAPLLAARDAGWYKGFSRCLRVLADTQFIIMEDRNGPPVYRQGFGEDMQVLVARPEDLPEITPASAQNAQAVVVTKLDTAPADFDLALETERLRAHAAGLLVFGVAALHDDRGLEDWQHWLEGRVLPRQH
jgi:CBS domain-containing protein